VTGGSLPSRGPVGDHAPVRLLAWAGFDAEWSALCVAWGVAVASLSLFPRLERGELRGEVVEAQRAL
jgi:hypothetical protein